MTRVPALQLRSGHKRRISPVMNGHVDVGVFAELRLVSLTLPQDEGIVLFPPPTKKQT